MAEDEAEENVVKAENALRPQASVVPTSPSPNAQNNYVDVLVNKSILSVRRQKKLRQQIEELIAEQEGSDLLHGTVEQPLFDSDSDDFQFCANAGVTVFSKQRPLQLTLLPELRKRCFPCLL